VADNGQCENLVEAAWQIDSLDPIPIQNEAMHGETDRKNDAENPDAADL